VEQLRRYPARPSAAEVQANLYLIDAKGGTPTLIGSEPEPWLSVCEAPGWSHAGDQIAFHARTGVATNPISRVKDLDLVDGRLRIKDLGTGAYPEFSPTDDRIIFLLPVEAPDENQFAPADLRGGVWMMQADGEGRRKLAGTGRPRWSPDGHQFLVVSPSEPHEVTVIDDRVGGKSGVLKVPDGKIFSMPAWAEPGTIVAALGIDSADRVALVDVSDPENAQVKEVLWKRRDDRGPTSSYPVYSPATRRCVFVGTWDGQSVLMAVDRDSKAVARPIEAELPPRASIRDVAISPDGSYLLFVSDARASRPGARRHSIDAPAIGGITVDGDLNDWPPAIPRHPIQNMLNLPGGYGPGNRQHAFLSTDANLSACFSVAYDPEAQLLYLAIIVRDDELFVGRASPMDTDAIEVYVDGLHTDRRYETYDWTQSETIDAGSLPVLQYVGLPDRTGPVYGVLRAAGKDRPVEQNPVLAFGDITKTKTRMAYRREGDVTTYEWALQAFDHYPDKPTRLLPGVQIGFDVVVCDRDKPVQTREGLGEAAGDRTCWMCWGPTWRSPKFTDPGNLGEIILGRPPTP